MAVMSHFFFKKLNVCNLKDDDYRIFGDIAHQLAAKEGKLAFLRDFEGIKNYQIKANHIGVVLQCWVLEEGRSIRVKFSFCKKTVVQRFVGR